MPAPATNDVVASAVQDLVAGTQQQTSVTQPVSDLPVTPTPEPSTSTTMTAPAPAPAAPDPIAAPVVAPPLATTPIVEPVTVAPAPVVTAPEPASAPEPTVVTPTPAPAPAPESTAASDATDDGVTIPGKKVIKPLATNEQAVQPADLNTLLAKEGISDINGGDAQPTHAPGHVISPMAVDANGQPVDPSSISL